MQDHLADYVELFPEEHWRTLYFSGTIVIPASREKLVGTDIGNMLLITKRLKKLCKYKGYAKLLGGFRNPPQASATMFEVRAAEWCADRAVTTSLEFAPEVMVGGKAKSPDFLWQTTLGDLFVECKRGDIFENALNRKFDKLFGILRDAYKLFEPWDPMVRLDVTTTGHISTGNAGPLIRRSIEQASMALRKQSYVGQVFEAGTISARIRPRTEVPPLEVETIRNFASLAEPTPKEVGLENAQVSFSISAAKQRESTAGHLLREARTQLPRDQPGAVFIEMPSMESPLRKVEMLLSQSEYRNTPWVLIWTPDELRAAWKLNQPFDGRLVVGKRG